MPRTLLQLRTEAQQRANQENKTLVGTAEWDRYLNEAISELYDLVIASNPHYYVSSANFTLTSSNQVALSTLTNFYKLRGVDYQMGTRPLTVRPLNFAERNRFSQTSNFSGTYTAWWTPTPPILAADGNELDAILDVWSEFIPVTAAIQAMIKEETPINEMMAVKARIEARIREASPNRDGEPAQAADLMFGQTRDSGRRYSLEGGNLVIYGGDAFPWW